MISSDIRRRRVLARLSLYTIATSGGPSLERMREIEAGVGEPLTPEEVARLRHLQLYPSEPPR